MSPEIYWLTWSALLTTILWIPYGMYRISRIGFIRLVMAPLPGDDPLEAEWAHRSYRVHMNSLETIAIFAPIAIAVHVTGAGNEVTAVAAATYFWSRVAYIPIYIFNVPVLRLVLFLIALISTLVMGYQLIG